MIILVPLEELISFDLPTLGDLLGLRVKLDVEYPLDDNTDETGLSGRLIRPPNEEVEPKLAIPPSGSISFNRGSTSATNSLSRAPSSTPLPNHRPQLNLNVCPVILFRTRT